MLILLEIELFLSKCCIGGSSLNFLLKTWSKVLANNVSQDDVFVL